jgi:hypothetical protein
MKTGTFKAIMIAIVALIVIIVALMLFLKPGNQRYHKKTITDNNIEQRNSDPVFRKDGELQFLGRNDKLLAAISIEVADNENERTQGLMYRDSLPSMSGMLFMFPTEEPLSFWMKNTRFSLDIIYIDSERKIVSISKNTTPYSLESIPSAGPAMYVVEVPAGFSNKYGLNEQCRIVF